MGIDLRRWGTNGKEFSSCQGHKDSKPVARSKLQDWSPVGMRSLDGKLHITQVTAARGTRGGLSGT